MSSSPEPHTSRGAGNAPLLRIRDGGRGWLCCFFDEEEKKRKKRKEVFCDVLLIFEKSGEEGLKELGWFGSSVILSWHVGLEVFWRKGIWSLISQIIYTILWHKYPTHKVLFCHLAPVLTRYIHKATASPRCCVNRCLVFLLGNHCLCNSAPVHTKLFVLEIQRAQNQHSLKHLDVALALLPITVGTIFLSDGPCSSCLLKN